MNLYEIFITFGERFNELLIAPSKNSDILWIVMPLLIATIIMFVYFQKYKDEELGWNSAVANSLVALFVSIALLRHIYFIENGGTVLSLTDNGVRTVFSLLLLFMTFILLIINFQHALPKKIAYYISSPLTINLVSYLTIVFVYSKMPFDLITFIVLMIFFAFLRAILYLIHIPLVKLFKYINLLKEQEEIKDVEKAHKKIKKEKKEIKKEEKKLKDTKIKELKKKRKQIKRIRKKVIKK